MRRIGGVACRPSFSTGWRGFARFDHMVSACGARPHSGGFGLGRGRRNRWGQVQDSSRRASCADVRRAPLSASHLLTITLPPWLLAICYALVGWSIGLRFSRETILYAWKQLPVILVSIFTLIALCGGLAFGLHEAAGTDALTAYLATSPGGADAVAIIAVSSRVDLPFVMAMQIGRLLVALLVGPTLARTIARWAGSNAAPSPVQSGK
jgi:membrane AbrB-like protein